MTTNNFIRIYDFYLKKEITNFAPKSKILPITSSRIAAPPVRNAGYDRLVIDPRLIQEIQMMDVIELTPDNYKDYFPTDLIACSYAYAGAMGEGGRVQFMDRTGTLYHLNYCYGPHEWTPDMLDTMFPFDQCTPGIFDAGGAPESWNAYYMGAGNFLYIHDTILEAFEERKQNTDCFLYKDWVAIVKSIVEDIKQ